MTAPTPEAAAADGPDAPIGIFDSGVGGLTVTRALVDQLPGESLIYVGDTAHGPYGPQDTAAVAAHSRVIADNLIARGVKMIVIACNTATSAFLLEARRRYPVPVVGVIRPAVRRAVATTRNGRIGVIGTTGTIDSGVYQNLLENHPGIDCTATACPMFVDFVERGITSGRQILGVAQGYLAPLQAAGVDTLVLGCTHYPLLTGVIQLAMGDHVTLVSSAEETAKDVLRILNDTDMLASTTPGEASRRFESTGDPRIFAHLAGRFLGPSITSVSQLPDPLA
ncbi:glutamate racemase [Corynebacterium mendelii]|uniref:Glutamate racemase n=1 Tax=Corynebacterium mendelii TaxID=2765362 RepID=A0A939ITR5_9CORY|nr:glutamate racemase [Corynebacterium mendelii]MBN9644134.1 glutamate racemase [Corynebacterium mendelii]